MALISGLAGVLGRFAGRLLNAALGWATILLFGKVSGSKQTLLLVVALSSMLWIVLLVGVVVPDVGTTLIAFVPVPSFISDDLIRLAMLVAALLLPAAVGIAMIVLTEGSKRPHGFGLVKSVVRGYPFTLFLAMTIAVLAVVATVRKLRSLAGRREDAHVAVIVKPGRYDEVLSDLERVLREGGIDVRPQAASRILSTPPKILAKVAGEGVGSLVPDRLMLLKGPEVEALVYPSDISLVGGKEQVALARALIAAELTHAPAYMTATAESESVEDDLRALADRKGRASGGQLRAGLAEIDRKLMRLTIPFDEWETVYRQRLQVERDVLAPNTDPPAEPIRSAAEAKPSASGIALAAGMVALLALDIGLLVADRVAPPRNR